MAEKMISDLTPASGLNATDKFEIEQDSEVESTHVTVAMLLAHINTLLVSPVAADVAAIELSIGNAGVSLEVVEGRLTVAEGDIDALALAVAEADNTINLTITTLDGRVTTLETNLAAEVLARTATTDEVVAARGAFVDLSERLDDLAVNAGKVSSVFGREGDIVPVAGDYDFDDLGVTPTTLAGYGITDAAQVAHDHDAADITSGVLPIVRGGTSGEGFRYIEAEVAPTGQPVGTRWLNLTDAREYTLTNAGWVQWSGGQPIQGMTGGTDYSTEINALEEDVIALENDVTTLEGVVSGKAPTVHTHAVADVTGLQGALDAKAPTVHTHSVADVTGLQGALDAKADDSEITTINTALGTKASKAGEAFTGPISATTVSDSNGNVRTLLPTTANVATTLDSTHINKIVEKTNASAYTYTISPNLGVQGDVITVINSGTAGDITVARGVGVALIRGTTDGNITVAPGTMATLYRTGTTNRWMA